MIAPAQSIDRLLKQAEARPLPLADELAPALAPLAGGWASTRPEADAALVACGHHLLQTACALDSSLNLDELSAHVADCHRLVASHPALGSQELLALNRRTLALMDFFQTLREAKRLVCTP